MKKLILLIGLIGCIQLFGQVPSIMRITPNDKPMILILHRNDTCIFQPIYIQIGSTCVTNFESFEGMVYMITNIWGLANAYVQSNDLKMCGDPEEWAYENVNDKVIFSTINKDIFYYTTFINSDFQLNIKTNAETISFYNITH
jgi:uncharacterized protein YneR